MVEVAPRKCLSSAPAPPQGAPGGSGQLGNRRKRPAHWAPSHCLGGGARASRLQSRSIPLPLTIQALISSDIRLNASTVPTVSLSWLLKRHVPRSARVFGKMDIEGAEYTALPPAIPQLCKYVDAMLLELHDKHLKQTREHLRQQTRDDAAGKAAVQASHDALQQSKALHGALAALEVNRTAGKCRTKVKLLSASNT
jgi:FkbM family methyltransferase